MPYCCALGCPNSTSKSLELRRTKGITFHKFPDATRDAERRERWIANLRRKNFRLSDNDRICSQHFLQEMFDRTGQIVRLRPHAVPTLFESPRRLAQSQSGKKRRRDGQEELEIPEEWDDFGTPPFHSAAYMDWRRVGAEQGLCEDSDIACFLLRYYERTSQVLPSGLTGKCQACGTPLSISCGRCDWTVSTSDPGSSSPDPHSATDSAFDPGTTLLQTQSTKDCTSDVGTSFLQPLSAKDCASDSVTSLLPTVPIGGSWFQVLYNQTGKEGGEEGEGFPHHPHLPVSTMNVGRTERAAEHQVHGGKRLQTAERRGGPEAVEQKADRQEGIVIKIEPVDCLFESTTNIIKSCQLDSVRGFPPGIQDKSLLRSHVKKERSESIHERTEYGSNIDSCGDSEALSASHGQTLFGENPPDSKSANVGHKHQGNNIPEKSVKEPEINVKQENQNCDSVKRCGWEECVKDKEGAEREEGDEGLSVFPVLTAHRKSSQPMVQSPSVPNVFLSKPSVGLK